MHKKIIPSFVSLVGVWWLLWFLLATVVKIDAAVIWSNIRGSSSAYSVEGSLMKTFDAIYVDTWSTSSGKAKNVQNLWWSGLTYYQRRIVNDTSTCIDSTTPIISIASNGLATCRSSLPASCWSASGGTFTSMPTTDLCDADSIASAVTDEWYSPTNSNVWPFTWTCTRGTTVTCSAYSRWSCSWFVWRCNSWLPTPIFGTIPPPSTQCGFVNTYYWWNCEWSNGANDMCNECN